MEFNQHLYLSGDGGGGGNILAGNQYHGGAMSNNSNLFEFTFQDMLESDIQAEFDDISLDLEATGAAGLFRNANSGDILDDIDFNMDEALLSSQDWSMGFGTNAHSSMYSSQPMRSSNSLYHDDSMGALMVNPNSVMPVQRQQHQQQQQLKTSYIRPLSISTQQHSAVLSNTPSPISLALHSPHQQQQLHHHQQPQQQLHHRDIKILKISPPLSSPLQQVPSPYQIGPLTPTTVSSTVTISSQQASARKKAALLSQQHAENTYPKPAYSYSCLIALALKNSRTGSLSVSEIYKFMCDHFPYFRTAPSGWKNSVRHNLSLNKCFEKVEKPSTNGNQRKGCLWKMNPAKVTKMEEEVAKWSRKDRIGIKKGMVYPENLEALERGQMIKDYGGNGNSIGAESEDEEDPKTPPSVSSQGSHGTADPSSGGEIVDIDAFSSLQPDPTFTELSLQTAGGLFEDLETANPTFFHANYSILSNNGNSHTDDKVYNMLILNGGQKHIINM